MSFWPQIFNPLNVNEVLATSDILSVGGNSIRETPASTAWPTAANAALFIPFRISTPIIINTLFILNGSVVSGSFDLGIYDIDGTRLISTGSTLQVGITSLQSVTITPTELYSGVFYLAVASNSTLLRLYCQSVGAAAYTSFLGLARVTASFPLPANVTFATYGITTIPLIGLSTRTFV